MRILILNQVFYPDVVSTAQHASDLARRLAEEGHEVTVISSRRGYDDPRQRFASREEWQGVEILRAPCCGFGKAAKWRRVADFASFLAGCAVRLMLLPRHDVVIAMTTPPLISLLGAGFARHRGGRLALWVMDLNPDEAIAAGWLREGSVAARIFERLSLVSLCEADRIVALDRFMKERIAGKGIAEDKIAVVPPWALDDAVWYDEEGRKAFRNEHGLTGKFVVMYSGNHSPCHPLDTLLEAAARLEDNQEIRFCFTGGGSEVRKVKNRGLSNVVYLPYQPLEKLSASLSAADLHVVAMGDPFVGIVHPCKIYNILRLGIPFLYIGPRESHIEDLRGMAEAGDSISVRHGDVDAVVRSVVAAARAGQRRAPELAEIGAGFSGQVLMPKMMEALGTPARIAEEIAATAGA